MAGAQCQQHLLVEPRRTKDSHGIRAHLPALVLPASSAQSTASAHLSTSSRPYSRAIPPRVRCAQIRTSYARQSRDWPTDIHQHVDWETWRTRNEAACCRSPTAAWRNSVLHMRTSIQGYCLLPVDHLPQPCPNPISQRLTKFQRLPFTPTLSPIYRCYISLSPSGLHLHQHCSHLPVPNSNPCSSVSRTCSCCCCTA